MFIINYHSVLCKLDYITRLWSSGSKWAGESVMGVVSVYSHPLAARQIRPAQTAGVSDGGRLVTNDGHPSSRKHPHMWVSCVSGRSHVANR